MTDPRTGFQDANGVSVYPPDEVQHEAGARHGELVEVFPDGDAYVRFFDNSDVTELVKRKHLCGVPEGCRVGAAGRASSCDGRVG